MTKPRKSRLERKRGEILDAAMEAFRDHGYDAASMDAIAEIACASKRTVYNHFGSKEQLFRAVVARLLDSMKERKRIPWNGAEPLRSQLTEFARGKLAALETQEGAALVRVVLAVFIRDPELARDIMRESAAEDDHLVTWLRRAVEAGRLEVEDPELAAELFWGMVGGTLFWPQIFHGPMDDAHQTLLVAELVETFLSRFDR